MTRLLTKGMQYGTRWQKARLTYLSNNPLCVMCKAIGRIIPASVVDHIEPHRGNQELFWDTNNWQSLCSAHHNSTKQREEKNGYYIGNTVDGRPIDSNHPWNKK